MVKVRNASSSLWIHLCLELAKWGLGCTDTMLDKDSFQTFEFFLEIPVLMIQPSWSDFSPVVAPLGFYA
jgi:hypothetical protein